MSAGLEAIRERMAEYLKGQGVAAVPAWPGAARERQDGPVTAVSLRRCQTGPAGFQDYLGERYNESTGLWEEWYGRQATLTFGLDLYAPAREDGEALQAAFDALAAALLVYGLALGAGVSRTTLVLAGLAVSGMLTAGMNTIKLLYPDAIAGASDFLVGGLSGVTLSGLKGAVLYLITGTLLALLLAADLNVLCLGEQSAASLGLHIGAVRFLGILAAALLAGAAVSFAGLLSFVGLLAPHIARRLVGNNHRILLPAAMLLGAAFVVLCDVLARCLFAPFELPVGILLSLIGGPFFLGLLLHGRGRRMYD